MHVGNATTKLVAFLPYHTHTQEGSTKGDRFTTRVTYTECIGVLLRNKVLVHSVGVLRLAGYALSD